MSANILSSEERQQFNIVPLQISDADLVRFFMLDAEDMQLIDPRTEANHRLDQAAHICLLRWLGWSPVSVTQLPRVALVALCEQLQIDVPAGGLRPPAKRTSRKHAQQARKHLGWRKCQVDEIRSLSEWLKPLAAEHDRGRVLFEALLQQVYREKIVRPGVSRLERLVERVRLTISEEITTLINSQLSKKQKKQLDDLLKVPVGETFSPLQWLKETPSNVSRNELLTVLEKIEAIRVLELDKLDLGKIHPNRIKLLARRAKRRENWRTAGLKPKQRYLLLVCFLDQALPKMIDVAAHLHNKLIQGIFVRAESRRNEVMAKHGQSLNNKVRLLSKLGRMILDEEGITDLELRTAIYDHVSRDKLTQAVQECDAIAQPADYTSFAYADGSYSHLRVFGPKFLKAVQIQAEEKGGAESVLEAVQFIQAVDAGERVFEDPPLKFVPWQWKAYVDSEDDKPVNRRMYELCLHKCLARELENGTLWVPGSQEYTSFRHEWIADEVWPAQRKLFLEQYPDLADVNAFLDKARAGLDAKMAEANAKWPELKKQAWIDEEGKLHLARLDAAEEPPGTERLRKQLVRLFPRVEIAQLLLEVNNWVGIDSVLTNINEQERPVGDQVTKKMAVLMAEGLNIGLQNMSHCLSGVSYRDLAGTYDRYFREETLRKAMVAVVNFYHRLPITRYWGDGTASSSDGQLFGVPVKTIYSQYHPKSPSKSKRALSLYRHVSDHGIPFYIQVIHKLGHEGAYVLAGLLGHNTDLDPKRHYIDTGGYEDILWAICFLLGIALEPRIRDIGDMRLFRMRRKVDQYEHIRALFKAPINTRVIRENWDDVLRVLASIRSGVVPASRILGKLNTYHVESGLYEALREIGRIAKTLFILDYATKPEVQRRVQIGLNRQESVHSLSKSVAIGHRGEFRLRDLLAQLNRAGCMQLVIAMIITWSSAYLAAAVDKMRSEGVTIEDEQLAHILPLTSEHINLLGRYEFDLATPSVQTDISALPLRSVDEIVEQLGLV